MENYKIKNSETSLSFASYFNRAAAFNVFIITDEASSVVVYLLVLKFKE